jgi:hypothetical protein
MRTVLDLHQGRARSDLLFTMSDNMRPSGKSGRTRNFSLLDERITAMAAAPKRIAPKKR